MVIVVWLYLRISRDLWFDDLWLENIQWLHLLLFQQVMTISCKEDALGFCFKLHVTLLDFQNISYKF